MSTTFGYLAEQKTDWLDEVPTDDQDNNEAEVEEEQKKIGEEQERKERPDEPEEAGDEGEKETEDEEEAAEGREQGEEKIAPQTKQDGRLAEVLDKLADTLKPAEQKDEQQPKSFAEQLGVTFPDLDKDDIKAIVEDELLPEGTAKLFKMIVDAQKNSFETLAANYEKKIAELEKNAGSVQDNLYMRDLRSHVSEAGADINDFVDSSGAYTDKANQWFKQQPAWMIKAVNETFASGTARDAADVIAKMHEDMNGSKEQSEKETQKTKAAKEKIEKAQKAEGRLPQSMAEVAGGKSAASAPDNLEESDDALTDFRKLTGRDPKKMEELFSKSARMARRGR